MTGKATETDKDVLRRIVAEPTFAKIREAAIRENAKRRENILGDLWPPHKPKPKATIADGYEK